MGDDIVDISTEKETLKNKTRFYDSKWLEESETAHLKQCNDEKSAKPICSRNGKTNEKTIFEGCKAPFCIFQVQ